MQLFADAVTGQYPYHGKAIGFRQRLHSMPYIAQALARIAIFQRLIKALLCHLNQPMRFLGAFARKEGLCHVRLIAVQFHAQVHRNNVPFLNHTITGNAMYNFIVDRNADMPRETAIAIKRGLSSVRSHEFPEDIVYLLRCHAGTN